MHHEQDLPANTDRRCMASSVVQFSVRDIPCNISIVNLAPAQKAGLLLSDFPLA